MKNIFKKLEQHNPEINIFIDGTDIEISAYSPGGGDFNAAFNAQTLEALREDMAHYIDGYDIDAEAALWIGEDGHGKNGAPYHIADIVTDQTWWRDLLSDLHDFLLTIKA